MFLESSCAMLRQNRTLLNVEDCLRRVDKFHTEHNTFVRNFATSG